jgi:hypothetical protein
MSKVLCLSFLLFLQQTAARRQWGLSAVTTPTRGTLENVPNNRLLSVRGGADDEAIPSPDDEPAILYLPGLLETQIERKKKVTYV